MSGQQITTAAELDSLPRRRIYVASSWRCAEQPAVVEALRAAGHEVYDFRNPPGKSGFAWSEVDPEWLGWTIERYRDRLDHARAVEGFAEDFAAMQWADTFVLVLPCGRSAHLELGWAAGQAKPTAILLSQDKFEPELMYRMVDKLATSLPEVVEWVGSLPDRPVREAAQPTAEQVARAICEADAVTLDYERRLPGGDVEPDEEWRLYLGHARAVLALQPQRCAPTEEEIARIILDTIYLSHPNPSGLTAERIAALYAAQPTVREAKAAGLSEIESFLDDWDKTRPGEFISTARIQMLLNAIRSEANHD